MSSPYTPPMHVPARRVDRDFRQRQLRGFDELHSTVPTKPMIDGSIGFTAIWKRACQNGIDTNLIDALQILVQKAVNIFALIPTA